jgi:hypothetical protein
VTAASVDAAVNLWWPRPHDGTRRSLAGEAATPALRVKAMAGVPHVIGSARRILSDPGPPPSEAGAAHSDRRGWPSLETQVGVERPVPPRAGRSNTPRGLGTLTAGL